MPFVKLDCGILNSTLWMDSAARDVFITALLMAYPMEFDNELPEIATRSLSETGWKVPPGWYGFVAAASVGIIRTAGLDLELGMQALERLAAPDENSRSPDFDGRRLVRISGGFLVLNFMKYRDRDYPAAERQKRYRDRKRNGVTSNSNAVTSRNVTQAEAEAEAEAYTLRSSSEVALATSSSERAPRTLSKKRQEENQENLKALRRAMSGAVGALPR